MRSTVVCLAVITIGLNFCGCGRDSFTEIPYSPDFVALVEGGKVSQVEIVEEAWGGMFIRGECKPGASADVTGRVKAKISGQTPSAEDLLRKHQVAYQVRPANPVVWQSFTGAFPLILFGIWLVVVIFVLMLALRLVRAVERIATNTEK